MIQLSAFADEISPELNEQIAVLQACGISGIELRGVWGVNVLDLSEEQVATIQQALQTSGIHIAAIASPIGKTPIDQPFAETLKKFARAVQLAQAFQARYIRIFSFYPPTTGNEPASWRKEVLYRLRYLADQAKQADLILVHENEKDIYGDTIDRCVDILQSINHPHLRAAFDPANFIQCNQKSFPKGYQAIKPWLSYVHVKDALADGDVVAAGEGLARWPETLSNLHHDGYDGYYALEPHLATAGQFQGFSGPEQFQKAARAFARIVEQANLS